MQQNSLPIDTCRLTFFLARGKHLHYHIMEVWAHYTIFIPSNLYLARKVGGHVCVLRVSILIMFQRFCVIRHWSCSDKLNGNWFSDQAM